MNTFRFFPFLFVLLLSSCIAGAGELQFFAGANSTSYDDVPEADTWGISLRAQYNLSNAASGWIINLFAPGQSILASQVGAGYEWKSQGDLYFEGGLGAAYSRIWGPSPMVIAGMGYRVSQTVFFDLPVMLTSSLVIMPYIGIAF